MSTKVFYRPELDVLRFGAFALVFCAHGFPSKGGYSAAGLPYWIWGPLDGLKQGGGYGVDLFFLLSSYLITEILLREYRKTSTVKVQAFWARRILRIWPLYFAFIGFAYWIVPLLYPQNFPSWLAFQYSVFIGNFAVIGAPPGINTVAGILWSVSIEEQFYLMWPLILRFFMSRLKAICIGLLILSNITRLYLVFVAHVTDPLDLWYNTLTRLDPIAVGALFALALNGRTPVLRSTTRVALIVGGLVIIVVAGMFWKDTMPLVLIGYPAATLAALLMLSGTLGLQARIPRVFVYLGQISYGLYVFHILALTIVRAHIHLFSTFLEWALQFTGAFLITVVLASISYRWLESPFLRLKERFSADRMARVAERS